MRRERSRSVLASLLKRARRLRDDYSDAGKMAEAIGYMMNQRKPLRRFLDDGRIPIDNNACERAIRPIAIGRRNWLFAGSLRGGRAAAVVYTLIECCKIADIDMVDYLADVLVRVATHPASRVDELLPERWAAFDPEDPMHGVKAAAVQGVIAFGARQGGPVERFGDVVSPRRRQGGKELCAEWEGFSLHAAVRIPAGHRDRLERHQPHYVIFRTPTVAFDRDDHARRTSVAWRNRGRAAYLRQPRGLHRA